MKFLEQLQKLILWIIGLDLKKREPKTPGEKLLVCMRVTAKCRFNASTRLGNQGKHSFVATTILSLGLVFIPLMQNSDIKIAFPPKVLNMMQIFLAVSVLVYSIIISKAGYEVRSFKLNECGDKIKVIIRRLDKLLHKGDEIDVSELQNLNDRYNDIIADTENHDDIDYLFATLDLKNDYCITGMRRVCLYILAYFQKWSPYTLIFLMIIFEAVFILDMIGVTKILVPFLT